MPQKWEIKGVGGGLRSKTQVGLIWKSFSTRVQSFLPFVNILLGARDIFRQSSAAPAKMSEIPIHPLLKNYVQNEHLNTNFHHVVVILTGLCMFSHVILWVTPGNSEKIPEKCRVGVLSRIIWLNLGQNQGNSLIFTKIAISQKHIFWN